MAGSHYGLRESRHTGERGSGGRNGGRKLRHSKRASVRPGSGVGLVLLALALGLEGRVGGPRGEPVVVQPVPRESRGSGVRGGPLSTRTCRSKGFRPDPLRTHRGPSGSQGTGRKGWPRPVDVPSPGLRGSTTTPPSLVPEVPPMARSVGPSRTWAPRGPPSLWSFYTVSGPSAL